MSRLLPKLQQVDQAPWKIRTTPELNLEARRISRSLNPTHLSLLIHLVPKNVISMCMMYLEIGNVMIKAMSSSFKTKPEMKLTNKVDLPTTVVI